MRVRRLAPVLLALVATACGPEAPPKSASAPRPRPPAFENPGGMWMPEQLPAQAEALRSLGFDVPAAALADPRSKLLSAIASLGGCSASFISADGLLATNHHCSTGALVFNSTPKDNLVRDGYLAKTRADEKWNGPTARVFVTESTRDVTAEMRAGLAAIADDRARQLAIEARDKALVAACEKDRPGVRCRVASYFGGAEYRLIEQLEIRDVRLVFAPHGSVGHYGGEIDNWHWPRNSGDVSLIRAYVGKDGKPADYAPDNVPYHPPHHLTIATRPLADGDRVMVIGYPGETNRLRSVDEANEAVSWLYPWRIQHCEDNLAMLATLTAGNADLTLKATYWTRGFANAMTKYRGVLEGLTRGGLAAEKAKTEAALRSWIDADPARKAAHGGALEAMSRAFEARRTKRLEDATLAELYRMSSLLGSAATIVRMAEERPKPDAERDPAYQARTWQRLEQAEAVNQKRYDRALDKALFKLALERTAMAAGKPGTPALSAILGEQEPLGAAFDTALDPLYAGTALESLDARIKLLRTATVADLAQSTDPMIRVALALRPLQRAMEDRAKAYEGAMSVARARHVEALRAHDPRPIAPDANSTLRITYGSVRGYRPTPQAPLYRPFTTLAEMVAKSTGNDPYDAPEALLAPFRAKKFGPWVDPILGEVPVDFLSDLDITGGNSGSATLDAHGDLVGLAFDGNYESMASDWIFQPAVTRTIHVDIRYVLWMLDLAYPGHHLLREMGVTPSSP